MRFTETAFKTLNAFKLECLGVCDLNIRMFSGGTTMWTKLRTTAPEQQLTNVFWKGPESQYFVDHALSVETTELCG